jgi:hypothetical protein
VLIYLTIIIPQTDKGYTGPETLLNQSAIVLNGYKHLKNGYLIINRDIAPGKGILGVP